MSAIKKVFPVLCMLLTVPVMAQNPNSMDQLMQGAAQMATCFQNLDQDKLSAMAEEGQAMEKELKQLCAAGERDKAQAKAMEYGVKFMASEEFKQLMQCGEMAKQMMPQMPDYSAYTDPESDDYKNRHVCDEL